MEAIRASEPRWGERVFRKRMCRSAFLLCEFSVMVFASLIFLFVFLPTFLILYFLTPSRWRNLTALLGSYFFYAWGAPRFVFVLFASSAADYFLTRLMEQHPARKKHLFVSGLVYNIALLGCFKYANFFIGEVNRFLDVLGASGVQWTHIALPIGISFFTFQKISYLVDVYRGTADRARSLVDYALYIALFPQLIAGPIVRYHDIAAQLRTRAHTPSDFMEGVWRFCRGLAKKVLIANPLGYVADAVFAAEVDALTGGQAWVGILCYALQIYFDFAGYSDMAVGLGRIMGFRFLENFNLPYIARSMTEFWQRWHISLSRFMKEYLYIPLGGNRVSRLRMYVNLWLVFLLSGLWHGAAWTFVVWGAWHGLWLMLEKMGLARLLEKTGRYVTVPITFFLVLIGWVFFRSETLAYALQYLGRMAGFVSGAVQPVLLWPELVDHRTLVVLVLAVLISFVPMTLWYERAARRLERVWHIAPVMIAKYAASLVLLALSAMSLLQANFNPFIYFRF